MFSRERLLIAACAASLAIGMGSCRAQAPCQVRVPESVEVPGERLSLADLLVPDTCPELLGAASQVRLGSAPLAGSVRVIEGQVVRNLLEGLGLQGLGLQGLGFRGELEPSRWSALQVPERISVRRSGGRASCAEIAARIPGAPGTSRLSMVGAASIWKADDTAGGLHPDDCGAAGRILPGAQMEVMEAHWDRTLRSRIVRARCARPDDCVPFVIRVRDAAGPEVVSAVAGAAIAPRAAAKPAADRATRRDQSTLVRPGEAATLVWNQDGIALVAPAVCLDKGAKGDRVRARIAYGGSVVRAIVEEKGTLRVPE